MSASNPIAGILEEWLQLTRAEGAAIAAAAWDKLRQVQARKAAVQKALAQLERPNAKALAEFRPHAARIISLLARNSKAVAAQKRRAQERQKSLDETKKNLRRIQQSYFQAKPRAAWHSYS